MQDWWNCMAKDTNTQKENKKMNRQRFSNIVTLTHVG